MTLILHSLQNTTTSRSAESLREIFCRSTSDSNVSFCEEKEEIPAVENYTETVESEDIYSNGTCSDPEEESNEGKSIKHR